MFNTQETKDFPVNRVHEDCKLNLFVKGKKNAIATRGALNVNPKSIPQTRLAKASHTSIETTKLSAGISPRFNWLSIWDFQKFYLPF